MDLGRVNSELNLSQRETDEKNRLLQVIIINIVMMLLMMMNMITIVMMIKSQGEANAMQVMILLHVFTFIAFY